MKCWSSLPLGGRHSLMLLQWIHGSSAFSCSPLTSPYATFRSTFQPTAPCRPPPPLPQTSQPPAPLLVYHVLNTLSYSDVTLTKQALLSDPRATSHRKLFKINTSYSEVPQWEYCCCPWFLVLIPVVQKHLEDEPRRKLILS